MKTYIKPSMRVYEILFPSHLLGDSTTKSGNTLQNDKGLVHNHTEEDRKKICSLLSVIQLLIQNGINNKIQL